MEIDDKLIDETTDELYRCYGSGTGILFGIPTSLRPAVRAVVKAVLIQEDLRRKNLKCKG